MSTAAPPPEPPTDPADAPGPTATPHCYRHPNRETWVRCSRCDRPICPDCMHEAAVGHQCPECVREGNRSVRAPRTTFGGMIPARSGQLTRVLIAANAVLFLIQQASNTFTQRFDLIPKGIPGTAIPKGVADGEYYRLITSAFLHATWLHIFFNMYALLIVGPILEQLLGRMRFLTLYFLSALGGSACAYLLMPVHGQALGASGAIFGLFGALFIVTRRIGADSSGILFLIGINLVLTFTIASISWQAHVGGLVTGSLLAAAYAYAPRERQGLVQGMATALVAIGIVVVVIARTAALT